MSNSSSTDTMSTTLGIPQHPVAEFLFQLTKMLKHDNRKYIEWINGKIKVHDPLGLADNILPKYFRHNKYSSFQRQLNYFGFRKLAGKGKMSPCAYVNDTATKDLSSLLRIRRKATVSSTKRRKVSTSMKSLSSGKKVMATSSKKRTSKRPKLVKNVVSNVPNQIHEVESSTEETIQQLQVPSLELCQGNAAYFIPDHDEELLFDSFVGLDHTDCSSSLLRDEVGYKNEEEQFRMMEEAVTLATKSPNEFFESRASLLRLPFSNDAGEVTDESSACSHEDELGLLVTKELGRQSDQTSKESGLMNGYNQKCSTFGNGYKSCKDGSQSQTEMSSSSSEDFVCSTDVCNPLASSPFKENLNDGQFLCPLSLIG